MKRTSTLVFVSVLCLASPSAYRQPGTSDPAGDIAPEGRAFGASLGRQGSEPRTLHVDAASGVDVRDCAAPERACRTLQRAADLARGGDEVIVRPGTYYERPVFRDLGSSRGRPVWIHAEPRGSATLSGMWREAAEGRVEWRDEGGGVYSTPGGAKLFAAFRGVFLFRFLSLADLRAASAATGAGTVATPPYGIAAENGRLYVRLPGDTDPNGHAIRLSSPSWNDDGSAETETVLRIEGSPYVILDGLRIEGSGTFCVEFDRDSRAATVRNVVLDYCRYGLRLPDESLVEWTEYSYPGLGAFADAVRERNGGALRVYDLLKEYQRAWMEGGLADSYGHGGTARNLEFRFNFLHEAFDGESLGDFEFSRSHHNVYLRNFDDHIELESWAGHASRGLHVHDNLFLSAGLISHQGESIVGPQFVYRNIWYFLDDDGLAMWTVVKSDAPNAHEGIYYHHNLLWSHRAELFWEIDNLHFHDNLLIFERNLNWVPIDSDDNTLVNDEDKPWLRGPAGLFAGTDPAAVLTFDSARLRFGRRAALPPNVGPFSSGDTLGPDWPRPRRTVFVESAPERWIVRGTSTQ